MKRSAGALSAVVLAVVLGGIGGLVWWAQRDPGSDGSFMPLGPEASSDSTALPRSESLRVEEPVAGVTVDPELDSSDSSGSDPTSESKPKKPKWARYPPGYQPPDDSFFEARYADQGLEELQAAFDQVVAVISEEAGRRLEEDYANGVYEELDAERVEYEPGQFGYQSPPRDPRYLMRTGSKRGDISKVHVTSLDPSLHQDLYDMRAECFWIQKRKSELGATLGGAAQWEPAQTGSK